MYILCLLSVLAATPFFFYSALTRRRRREGSGNFLGKLGAVVLSDSILTGASQKFFRRVVFALDLFHALQSAECTSEIRL